MKAARALRRARAAAGAAERAGPISAGDVAAGIGEPYFSRGRNYLERGKVRSARLVAPDSVEGSVLGSGGRVYRQDVALGPARRGRTPEIEGLCSCPMGYNCKHVAAVLLSVARESRREKDPPAAPPEPEPDELPAELRRWIADLRQADAPPAPTPPETSRRRLLYVFRAAGGGAEIVPVEAFFKKNGELAAGVSEYRHVGGLFAANFIDSRDVGLLAKLESFGGGRAGARAEWPEGEELWDFLREAVATGRARGLDARGAELRWAEARAVRFAWEAAEGGRQRLAARDGADRPVTLLPFPALAFLDPGDGAFGPAETDLPDRLAARFAGAPEVPAPAAAAVARELARATARPLPAPRRVSAARAQPSAPQGVLRLHAMREDERGRWARAGGPAAHETPVYPCVRVEFAYAGAQRRARPDRGGDLHSAAGEGIVAVRRDFAAERRLEERASAVLRECGGEPPGALHDPAFPPAPFAGADFVFLPVLDDSIRSEAFDFTVEGLPALRGEGWTVEIDPSWPFRIHDGPIAFRAGFESSGADWFSVALNLEAGGHAVDLAPLLVEILETLPTDGAGGLAAGLDVESLLAGETFYALLPGGARAGVAGKALAPFVSAFLEAQKLFGFHLAEAGRAAALAEALEGCGAAWSGGEEILALGRRLRTLAAAPEEDPPAALNGVFRPYQRAGYGWLKALAESGFGGVLADDMGLGKTVQALAILLRRHVETDAGRPSLLVAPTSLVGNWEREAARFAPDLRLLTLHGPDRKARFGEIPRHHLVLTTYPLIHRDREALFAHEYELAILDEAQAVKNPASAGAKRIRDVRARCRLALTGTPLENNLVELWTLFDWLIPGLLGARREFTRNFRTPIEKRGDDARRRMLSARIKPFLLRRTKDEVAQDLPPKTEIDEVVPLAGGQRALYEAVRTAMDERVREAIRARGLDRARMTILDALLKLRQTCCDPRLVKLQAARKVAESAKRERLNALLEELMAEGRKVLVFSQFVEMLRLIESDIAARGWDYAMLHGRTKNRRERIDEFQSGRAQIFLISLKAGGVGLNLTAADTVILYDPWWNPAVERQAMDRAHRIGQDKPVFVHRLIAEGTVEATIREMQARKQALADALFEGGGKGPLSLADADLDALLAPIS